MSQLILTIDRNGVIVNNSVTLATTNIDRLSDAYRSMYFPTEGILVSAAVPATDDGMGNTTPYIPAVYREPTKKEIAGKIAEVVFSNLKQDVLIYERAIATRSATSNVADVVIGTVTQ